ncbi:hypothetical protein S40288_00519 [Stachybotrys chartarum IBT 40288]|nr:hypothetical protein S40288_00519 [Stachybotrys chartarum IBT 40288]
MHMISSVVTLGSMFAMVTAVSSRGVLEFPDSVPMEKRQPTGAAYDCHSDCGFAIRGAREDGYCDNEEWLGLLNDCLACANQFDIWIHYGDSVGEAAEACGLDATPAPVDGGEETSSAAAEPAVSTSAVVVETSTAEPAVSTSVVVVETTSAVDSTLVPVTTTSAEAAPSTSIPSTTTASAGFPGNATTPEPTPELSGAPGTLLSGAFAAVAAIVAAALLM